jgi:hypothetical protein
VKCSDWLQRCLVRNLDAIFLIKMLNLFQNVVVPEPTDTILFWLRRPLEIQVHKRLLDFSRHSPQQPKCCQQASHKCHRSGRSGERKHVLRLPKSISMRLSSGEDRYRPEEDPGTTHCTLRNTTRREHRLPELHNIDVYPQCGKLLP